MRVVVAPDKFAGTLSAGQVAEAFARGWVAVRPDDELDLVPMSDGGPGFLACLAAAIGGDLITCPVTDPLGKPVTGSILVSGVTAYVESALANGLHLVPPDRRDPLRSTTYGVGELLDSALSGPVTRIVVGLGGSATNDGGAGMLAALGTTAVGEDGSDATALLRQGPAGFGQIAAVDLVAARQRCAGVVIVVATDVDSPLLGATGASRGFGRQKGADDAAIEVLESRLKRWRELCEAAGAPAGLADEAGAGAAGGLGYGLLLLGGHRVAGIDTVLSAVNLPQRCAGADLVVTGEGKFDWQSLHGKVVSGVVEAAGDTPVQVVTGQATVNQNDWRRLGITGVHSLVDRAGSVERAIAEAETVLEAVAADLARAV